MYNLLRNVACGFGRCHWQSPSIPTLFSYLIVIHLLYLSILSIEVFCNRFYNYKQCNGLHHLGSICFQAVRDKMEVFCRCHGVSGSCETKICFRRLSDFKNVATSLKKKYDDVINVVSQTKGQNKQMLRPRRGKRYTPRDLIALDPSPNYCKKSESRGTLGTSGRKCNHETTGKGSCAYMCCGRGHEKFEQEIEERCGCQYVWCCYVKCKKCKKKVTVSTCLWLKKSHKRGLR